MSSTWQPPYSLEERLKYAAVPPRLYKRLLVRRALKRGERELTLLPRLADPGRIAVDVGANKGVYTHLLAGIAPSVIAFEPNPKMYRILVRGLPRNAAAHAVALSNRSGAAELLIPGHDGSYSNQRATLRVPPAGAAEFGRVTVEARTLDSYELPAVGFIKIDVEGHEREVLDGARATIARDRPALLIEIEEKHTGRPVEDDLAVIEGLGYDGYFATDAGVFPLDRFDGNRAQRQRRTPGGYIFNFMFLPRGRPFPSVAADDSVAAADARP